MAVITISRQMGSLGRKVAKLAAETLGYRLVWRELWDEAARRVGHPELALAAVDELGLLGICPSPKTCHAYQASVQEVVEEVAAQGSVILIGRGGQAVLQGRPGVLHVRITAPIELRAQRVAQAQGIALDCAMAQVEASDRWRHNYLKRFYHLRWEDTNLYDLILNTAHMTPETAASLICQAAAHLTSDLNQPITPASPESVLDNC